MKRAFEVKAFFILTKYLSVFSLNAGKYGPEITTYLDTNRAVPLTFFYEITQYSESN